jgi:hypothetical protein
VGYIQQTLTETPPTCEAASTRAVSAQTHVQHQIISVCHSCLHRSHHRCRGLHTCNTSHHACWRQVQMACFDNMKVSSENREAHWCTSSGWVKSHAPPTTVVAVRMKRKGHPFDVLYMSCTSQLRWIDVPACLGDEVSKFANTQQNLTPIFGFKKWTQNEGRILAHTVCAGRRSRF